MRVFAISDLHLDYAVNADWLSGLSCADYRDDVLIVAGDVADMPHLLEWCFRELSRRFARVLYVPGNHDLWVMRDRTGDSVEKYRWIRQLASDTGVLMEPWRCGRLRIVPLLGWYDYSFGAPDPVLRERWMDYHACVWPSAWQTEDIAGYFTDENAPVATGDDDIVISFSHFLPRIDLMPAYIPPASRLLYPVLGSAALEQQLRRLRPAIHVYGHSHVNRHVRMDGVLYVNNAFGYPSEALIAEKRLRCIYEQ